MPARIHVDERHVRRRTRAADRDGSHRLREHGSRGRRRWGEQLGGGLVLPHGSGGRRVHAVDRIFAQRSPRGGRYGLDRVSRCERRRGPRRRRGAARVRIQPRKRRQRHVLAGGSPGERERHDDVHTARGPAGRRRGVVVQRRGRALHAGREYARDGARASFPELGDARVRDSCSLPRARRPVRAALPRRNRSKVRRLLARRSVACGSVERRELHRHLGSRCVRRRARHDAGGHAGDNR